MKWHKVGWQGLAEERWNGRSLNGKYPRLKGSADVDGEKNVPAAPIAQRVQHENLAKLVRVLSRHLIASSLPSFLLHNVARQEAPAVPPSFAPSVCQLYPSAVRSKR